MTQGEDAPSSPAPSRVAITTVSPQIEDGRFPIKRVVGDSVTVTADIFADGHDLLTAVLRHRKIGQDDWLESSMHALGNDSWTGEFIVLTPGIYEYTLEAWVNHFKSWRRDLAKKSEAGQDVSVDLLTGAQRAEEASRRAAQLRAEADALALKEIALRLCSQEATQRDASKDSSAVQTGLDEGLAALMEKYPDRRFSCACDRPRLVVVDREKARFSAWYELFPRSCASSPGKHGTFMVCEARLPSIAAMGFDVLYLPPIHPIGHTHRKGKDNAPAAGPEDPGSPWAIGAEEGGHTSIHPGLGTEEDFARLLVHARKLGLELALDLAYQCSPDHPWAVEHPEWFRHRPDGSIQYAENPPKKYQDIYPLDFECEEWQHLWNALRDVVFFWIARGIRIFRVDNPHTKPFAFWEWLIQEVKAGHPEVIFLAEAFTRPKVMQRLAKLGFSQSYTYFTWRNTRQELTEYFTELTQTDMREYFRPNLWTNTPDILTEYLQYGGRPAFLIRLVLAATLGANYGIYGPVFELCENTPLAVGTEEYLHAEKFEIRHWDLDQSAGLSGLNGFIAKVNRARRENPALQSDLSLRFHDTENDQIIAYTKSSDDRSNAVLVVVNLDPRNTQSGWVTLPLEDLGLNSQTSFQVHDLLTDARYLWQGPRNYIRLDPQQVPAHLFRIRHRVRRENDFDYFM
ncbi:MAG: maltotransferase domain-containing protein [Terriglobia bacterium]